MSEPLKDTKELSSMALYGRLLSYVKALWFIPIVIFFGFSVYAYSSIEFFSLLERIVDTVESGEEISTAVRLSIPLTLMAIVASRGFGGFLGSYYLAYLANHIVHRIRCQIIDRFLTLPVSFYDQRSAGHLMSTVTFNVTQISSAVTESLRVIIREGLYVIWLFSYLLLLNWRLTLLFVAVVPVISLVILYAAKKFRKHSNRIQKSMGDVTHILSETIKGFKVIRTFGAEKQVGEKFKQASELNLQQNLKMASISGISIPVIQIVVAFALALLLWFAMSPQSLGNMSSGEFVGFITASAALLKPIRQLSNVNSSIQKGLAAAKTIFELTDQDEEQDTGDYETTRVKGKVVFENVSFSYGRPDPNAELDTESASDSNSKQELVPDNSQQLLQDISFTCEPGQSIAIVGVSGSGKSTLVNLISRFYELDQGQILIDGQPHNNFTLQNLRQQISLVSQQVVLFNGSIRDNIAYGTLADRSEEDITQALKNANAMEFINTLPEGIETKVGDDATLLSGGQRQRLAIARALLKDAPILILDEATSALDSVSERYIQSALEKLMTGRTTFVIAHRLSTIEKADCILVMSEGRIVEKGTHQELLALREHYSRLHQMQFSEP